MNRKRLNTLARAAITRHSRILLILSALGAAAAVEIGFASRNEASASPTPSIAKTIVSEIGSDRVTSLESNGTSIVVTGTASAQGGEAGRTLWYQSIAAATYGQQASATSVTRNVIGPSGAVIQTETDRLGSDLTPPSNVLSLADLTNGLDKRASTVGATVVSVNYLPLLGGTAELEIQPNDPAAFIATAGARVATLLGPMRTGAYLVTVVDSKQTPVLVLGWTAGIGGGAGQGLGWVDPTMQTDSVWGAANPSASAGASNGRHH